MFKRGVKRSIQRLACVKSFYLADELEKLNPGHGFRIQESARFFFNVHPEYLEKINVEDLYLLSNFHDVGKLVSSNGSLKTHCLAGSKLALLNPDLRSIAWAILLHHEWWDGTLSLFNYREFDIPIISRLVNILNVYDNLLVETGIDQTSADQEIILERLEDLAGSQFDPDLTPKVAMALRLGRKEIPSCNRALV